MSAVPESILQKDRLAVKGDRASSKVERFAGSIKGRGEQVAAGVKFVVMIKEVISNQSF